MQGSALPAERRRRHSHQAVILDAVFGLAAAAGAGVVVRRDVGRLGGLAVMADAIQNGASAIDRKGVRGGQVLQKCERLVAFKMLQSATDQAFEMKMIAAAAVLAAGLVVTDGCARGGVGAVKALQIAFAAERVELTIERAFGDRFARLRGREVRA